MLRRGHARANRKSRPGLTRMRVPWAGACSDGSVTLALSETSGPRRVDSVVLPVVDPTFEPAKEAAERRLIVLERRPGILAGDQDHIEPSRQFVPRQSKRFAKQALEPAAAHRIAVPSGNTQTAAGLRPSILQSEDQQMPVPGSELTVVYASKLRRPAQFRRLRKAEGFRTGRCDVHTWQMSGWNLCSSQNVERNRPRGPLVRTAIPDFPPPGNCRGHRADSGGLPSTSAAAG